MSLTLHPRDSSLWCTTQHPKMCMSQCAPCPNVPPSPLLNIERNAPKKHRLTVWLCRCFISIVKFVESSNYLHYHNPTKVKWGKYKNLKNINKTKSFQPSSVSHVCRVMYLVGPYFYSVVIYIHHRLNTAAFLQLIKATDFLDSDFQWCEW